MELSADQRQEAPWATPTDLVAQARSTLLISLSGRSRQLTAVRTVLDDLRAQAKTGPGRITVRVLGSAAALRELSAWAGAADLAELRVTSSPHAECLVADVAEALIHAPGDSTGGLLVRDRATVRVLAALFMEAWDASMPWPDYQMLDAFLTTDTASEVLARLYAGSTDAVAARELGLSLRTYRRHVARILESLGVSSRFSGGTRAAELQFFDML